MSILVNAYYAIVKLKGKASSCSWKGVTVGYMVITEFMLISVAIFLKKLLGCGQIAGFWKIEVKISQLSVFRNRIIICQTDSLKENAADVMLQKKRKGASGKLLNLIVVQHHAFGSLKHDWIDAGVPTVWKHKWYSAVFLCQTGYIGFVFR